MVVCRPASRRRNSPFPFPITYLALRYTLSVASPTFPRDRFLVEMGTLVLVGWGRGGEGNAGCNQFIIRWWHCHILCSALPHSRPLLCSPLLSSALLSSALRCSHLPNSATPTGTPGCTIQGDQQKVCNENLGITSVFFDSSHVAAGGVRVSATMGTKISRSFFTGFLDAGVRIDGGHETIVDSCWFAEYFWNEKPAAVSRCQVGASRSEVMRVDQIRSDPIRSDPSRSESRPTTLPNQLDPARPNLTTFLFFDHPPRSSELQLYWHLHQRPGQLHHEYDRLRLRQAGSLD